MQLSRTISVLESKLRQVLGLRDAAALDPELELSHYGVSSINAAKLSHALSQVFGHEISPRAIIEHRHIDDAEQTIAVAPNGRNPDAAAVADVEIGDVEAEAIGSRRIGRQVQLYAARRIGNRHGPVTLAEAALIHPQREAFGFALRRELQPDTTAVAAARIGDHHAVIARPAAIRRECGVRPPRAWCGGRGTR